MAKDYRLEKRKFVIGGIALSIVLIYLIRLFVLQITTDDYKKNADSNAFLNKIQYPSRGAATGGTCRMLSVMVPDLEACGKTGTAQNRGHDHSVFMGFAPMNKPKIAIAVYVENGGWGATYGVPFGALLMEQYLKGKLSPENELRAEEFSNRVILYGNEER